MSKATSIESAADDLKGAQNVLDAKLALLRDTPGGEPREKAKEAIRLQLIQVQHCIDCLEDAIGFSLADELKATEHQEC
jgi:hypothetical protein